ncbi:hypothetical protein JCM21900_006161 [Sporobolomyces salmonicolor]
MSAAPPSDERAPLLAAASASTSTNPRPTAYSTLSSLSRPASPSKPVSRSPAPSLSDSDLDSDAPSPLIERSPAERRRTLLRWLAMWGAVLAAVIYCVVQAFRRGGGEFDWKKALKAAGGGGLAGALAMVLQVLLLMPLRTVMNYQYRYGTTTAEAAKKLYSEGGYSRYYSGLGPALVQGPVARFGDTAANAGILALLSSNPFLAKLPSPLKTAFASICGALFRMVLMPVDTLKTTMQTESNAVALRVLRERVKSYGPGTLWAGAWATAAANFVGSFPWFATYNYLSMALPLPAPPSDPSAPHLAFTLATLGRQAFIGFCASVISDTCSNSLRVVKTYRQVNRRRVGYRQAASLILRKEGARGLFGRGLKTRLLANGLQGLLFSVLWKAIGEVLQGWTGGGDRGGSGGGGEAGDGGK